MAMSTATPIDAFLASLPEHKRTEIAKVRAVVRKHLPKGYVEGMGYGMICYTVPTSRLPETYNDRGQEAGHGQVVRALQDR